MPARGSLLFWGDALLAQRDRRRGGRGDDPDRSPVPDATGQRSRRVPGFRSNSCHLARSALSDRSTIMAQDTSVRGEVTVVPDVTDEVLVERARRKEALAFELLMRRHNQRVYRV